MKADFSIIFFLWKSYESKSISREITMFKYDYGGSFIKLSNKIKSIFFYIFYFYELYSMKSFYRSLNKL